MSKLLLIGLFGFLGVVFRYLISEWSTRAWNYDFPLATLGINIMGSFLIGVCASYALTGKDSSGILYSGLIVGFLGGFTTFSSFTLETLKLFEQVRLTPGLLYLFGSPVAGVAAAALGLQLGKVVFL